MSWIDKIEYAFEKSNQKQILLPWRKKPLSIKNYKENNSIRGNKKSIKK